MDEEGEARAHANGGEVWVGRVVKRGASGGRALGSERSTNSGRQNTRRNGGHGRGKGRAVDERGPIEGNALRRDARWGGGRGVMKLGGKGGEAGTTRCDLGENVREREARR